MHPWECGNSQLRCIQGGSQTSPPTCPCTRTSQRDRQKSESSMIRQILPEPRPLGMFSPRRIPLSCLGSLRSIRVRRRMRSHHIHCRKLEPRQHRHDVEPALALDYALLAGQGPVARLRYQLAAAGRGDQAQGVCQVIMTHVGHLGNLLADHRMIYFGSNSCTAFARRGDHVSGRLCCLMIRRYQAPLQQRA